MDAVEKDPTYKLLKDQFMKRQVLKNVNMAKIGTLQHGLSKIPYNPGFHFLKDPRTKKYNFTRSVEFITQPSDFNYDALPPYLIPQKDQALKDFAQTVSKARFVSSTSSMTSALAMIYQVFNGVQAPKHNFSHSMSKLPFQFSKINRIPIMMNLTLENDKYYIAKKSLDNQEPIIASLLVTMFKIYHEGHSMEQWLTEPSFEYQQYLREENGFPCKEVKPEEFRYNLMGEFLVRSQIDCQDVDLPKKVFDIKTRSNLQSRVGLEYETPIRRLKGTFASHEREYYDMVVGPMLKYNFQVKLGMMDGIFVCYHDTKKVFGFQYLSEEEMDEDLFGKRYLGQKFFQLSLLSFQQILNDIVKAIPNESLKVCIHIEQNQLKVMIYGNDTKKWDGFQVDLILVEKEIEKKPSEFKLYYKTHPLPNDYFKSHELVPTLEELGL